MAKILLSELQQMLANGIVITLHCNKDKGEKLLFQHIEELLRKKGWIVDISNKELLELLVRMPEAWPEENKNA